MDESWPALKDFALAADEIARTETSLAESEKK